ncbi:lachesin-like [Chelonus insularis]|uniref:lachesin-like n=1 Tax=Chelonus insularis TaxID=460826 RepID=UPI00158B43CA|nr:lachesin-like [Chelonus insularis]
MNDYSESLTDPPKYLLEDRLSNKKCSVRENSSNNRINICANKIHSTCVLPNLEIFSMSNVKVAKLRINLSSILLLSCILFQAVCTTTATFTTVSTIPEPEFVEPIGNTTVPAGRSIKLACSVKDLGTYKVAWMLFDKSAILTVHNHVITRNPRISVSHDKHRTWYLHINNVHEDDKGKYMCQINTATAKTQYGYLDVVVPPNIDDAQSSSDAIVRENANVTLTCKATGSPTPSIRWKRDDNEKIVINKTLEVMEWEGETLEMTRISRLGMGAYLCIASNGVPPSVSKQIKVSVDFSPMLWIPHQLVGAPLGYTVTLECYTEAHPTSLNYWTRHENGRMIHDSKKYKTTSVAEKPAYKTHMTLTIYDLENSDYGSYKCVAKNPRGETDGTIRLYMSTPPSTSPSPTTTELVKNVWDVLTEVNNSIDSKPSSLMFPNGKTPKIDKKSGSNLNEINKSEQKSGDIEEKSNYNWPSNHDLAIRVATTTSVLILNLTVTWIIR